MCGAPIYNARLDAQYYISAEINYTCQSVLFLLLRCNLKQVILILLACISQMENTQWKVLQQPCIYNTIYIDKIPISINRL